MQINNQVTACLAATVSVCPAGEGPGGLCAALPCSLRGVLPLLAVLLLGETEAELLPCLHPTHTFQTNRVPQTSQPRLNSFFTHVFFVKPSPCGASPASCLQGRALDLVFSCQTSRSCSKNRCSHGASGL